MEAGIYSVVDIHSFRNMHSSIIYIYNKLRNTHLKLLSESKAKIPEDKYARVRYDCELRKVAALFWSYKKATG